MSQSLAQTLHQVLNRAGLIAARLEIGNELESAHKKV
jgi:hypothetical protein